MKGRQTLIRENRRLRQENAALKREKAQLKLELARERQRTRQLRRHAWGRKSEKTG